MRPWEGRRGTEGAESCRPRARRRPAASEALAGSTAYFTLTHFGEEKKHAQCLP
jgi:hypothetical protein